MLEAVRTPALGGDVTSVKCSGRGLPLGLTVDDVTGLELSGEEAQTHKDWMGPIAKQVGAERLVTDDADGFKTVAEGLGLEQPGCQSHVKRNTDEWIAGLRSVIAQGTNQSLAALGITFEQAWADVERLGQWIQTRRPEGPVELEAWYDRYGVQHPPAQDRPPAWQIACTWCFSTAGTCGPSSRATAPGADHTERRLRVPGCL